MNKLFFLFALIIANYGFAQNYAYIEKDSIVNLHYRLSDNKELYNTNMYFPCDGGGIGVNISKLEREENEYPLSVMNKFDVSSSTFLSIPIFYAANVKSIDFFMYDIEGYCYSFTKKLDFMGYQTGIFSVLTKSKVAENTKKSALRIYMRVRKVDDDKDFQLIFSNIMLADYYKKQLVSPLPLFRHIFPYNDANYTKSLSPIFKNSKSTMNWISMEYCQPRTFVKVPQNNVSNNRLLYDIIRACVIEYPYLKEKAQNQDAVLKTLDSIWMHDSLKSECDLAIKIQQYLRKSFHDGHFKIDLACYKDNRTTGPLRISYIQGKYQISAVLDTLLENDIPLGSTLLNINNKAVTHITDSLLKEYYTDNYVKERPLLTFSEVAKDIVSFEDGNKCLVEYQTPTGEIKKMNVLYKRKYPLKSNFISTHCEFKNLNSKISFFRMNVFDELSVVRFQSIVDSIKDKDIILDLRSNGGGDLSSVDDLLSFFIQKKEVSFLRLSNRDETVFDSLFYQSDNNHKVSLSSKIVILVDSKTACSSEVFIEAMKRNSNNVTIIGTDNTSGTIANAYNVFLPTKNYSLTINSPQMFKCAFGYNLEDVGIKPDIKVEINKVSDLKPYNDKVLQTAFEFLNQSVSINQKVVNNNK
jgi:hypothetical protein